MAFFEHLEPDKRNVLRTLYFNEETTWTQLRWWTRPRLDRRRLGDAVASLLAEGKIVVEKRRRYDSRCVQVLRLADPAGVEMLADLPDT